MQPGESKVAIIAPRDVPGRAHVKDQSHAASAKFSDMQCPLIDYVCPLKARLGGARRLRFFDG
jgi:hypothetical protein